MFSMCAQTSILIIALQKANVKRFVLKTICHPKIEEWQQSLGGKWKFELVQRENVAVKFKCASYHQKSNLPIENSHEGISKVQCFHCNQHLQVCNSCLISVLDTKHGMKKIKDEACDRFIVGTNRNLKGQHQLNAPLCSFSQWKRCCNWDISAERKNVYKKQQTTSKLYKNKAE